MPLAARLFAATVLITALTTLPAMAAGERHALVVGVNDYVEHTPLRLAVPDAELVGKALESIGFKVNYVLNPDRARLLGAVTEFAERVDTDDTAVFYFAGTGIETGGEQYLFASDLALTDDDTFLDDGITLQSIVAQVEKDSTGVNVFIFDACRNDPSETLTRGLTFEQRQELIGAETFMMYSTSPGQLTYEPAGAANTVFAASLAKYLVLPELSLADVARRLRREIYESSEGKMRPMFYDSTRDEIYLAAKAR